MAGFVVRPGCEADIDCLLDIERRAASLLLDHGCHDLFAMHSLSSSDLHKGIVAGILHVAEVDGVAVGFALCGRINDHAHLFEMDVLPEHGRRGIGSALLESVCDTARTRGWDAMTLSTLRDVPWNAPFYAGRGFSELAEADWGVELRAIMEKERGLGFPMRLRVVMRRGLGCRSDTLPA